MATPSGRTSRDLKSRLAREAYQFDFFQAVRLLERIALREPPSDGPGAGPVGEDESPSREVVRFAALTSLSFPPGEIAALTPPRDGADAPWRMTVPFLGLTGPTGVLPQHYTQLLIERVRRKDYALRDFLDLFHHRLISLFYRAWRKYRFVVGYERAADNGRPDDDLFTDCLYCLVGLGTGGLRGRQDVHDETYLYYAGHFAHAPRQAVALERIVGDYLDVPARVIQFVGQWLYLSREDQSRLPQAGRLGETWNNSLGSDVVVGDRVWGMENRFRVQLGPLGYAVFQQLSPRGALLRKIAQLIRTYVGAEFDFDVQPVLRAKEVPPCQLGGDAYLGWNTWVFSQPFPQDAADAIFVHEGW
ncbi:MAG: type VI secretion system baseplate subunit TssG [Pirellulaceae bacterium]